MGYNAQFFILTDHKSKQLKWMNVSYMLDAPLLYLKMSKIGVGLTENI